MQTVRVQWEWLNWNHGDVWSEDMVPQLERHGLSEQDLRTCVYVIAANGLFAIDYPRGVSPALYIGSGNFKHRLMQHQSWLSEITSLVHDYSFSIAVCKPRSKAHLVHKDMEGALLHKIREMYGCIPIRNNRIENPYVEYRYQSEAEFKRPLMIGRGVRYHWAIRPLKSNRFYKSYCARTAL